MIRRLPVAVVAANADDPAPAGNDRSKDKLYGILSFSIAGTSHAEGVIVLSLGLAKPTPRRYDNRNQR